MDLRFSRQLALPGFGEEQQAKLAWARVLIIGAGGLGASVIPSLAAAGVGTLGIVDDDTVETSNLHRQLIHGVADVGRRKVESAHESVRTISPETTVIPITERLTAHNALDIFAGFNLVLDGSDNFPTRYLASDAATLSRIPLVWGSVSRYGGQVSVAPPTGPGYRDLFPAPPPAGSVLSCEAGGVLPTVVALVGSIMSTEAIKLITGIGTPLTGRVIVIDTLGMSFRELEFRRDPTAAPMTGLTDYDLFCGVSHDDDSSISAAGLAARTGDFTLVDVREPWEAQLVSLPGSVLMPLGSLEQSLGSLDRSRPVIAYCHHGARSDAAQRILQAHGFDARHLAGGIDAWSAEVDSGVVRY